MQDISVEQARKTLRGYIEWALSHAGEIEEPVIEDSGPLPCDDPPNDDPDRARISLDYTTLVKAGPSIRAGRAIKRAFREEGWSLLHNRGAPKDQFSFAASKDGYTVGISAGTDVTRLHIGGDTPCVLRGDA